MTAIRHSARIDSKGRLLIPMEIREALNLQPGETIFFETEGDNEVFRCAKAVNPFDALADHAEREYRAGRTRSLRDFAHENDIPLSDG